MLRWARGRATGSQAAGALLTATALFQALPESQQGRSGNLPKAAGHTASRESPAAVDAGIREGDVVSLCTGAIIRINSDLTI